MANEIHNARGEYVGYYNTNTNTIVDVRKRKNGRTTAGGLGNVAAMATVKLTNRNAAERARVRRFRRNSGRS